MPVLALVLGVLICIWSVYGAFALYPVWIILFFLGLALAIWGANRLWWGGRSSRL